MALQMNLAVGDGSERDPETGRRLRLPNPACFLRRLVEAEGSTVTAAQRGDVLTLLQEALNAPPGLNTIVLSEPDKKASEPTRQLN